jgi:hypothetical protein
MGEPKSGALQALNVGVDGGAKLQGAVESVPRAYLRAGLGLRYGGQ